MRRPRGGARTANELPDRPRRILALLVREFIERGEPVSSSWIASHSGLGLSSATVRNELAQLEAEGYVHQPHTSAGRVPTDLGYRAYVDLLLQSRRPARPAPEVEERLRQAPTVASLLEHVSHELSRASHQLGFAMVPPADATTRLRQIDFVMLDASRVLVVVVAMDGQVTQKLVDLAETMTPTELTQAASYLNGEFVGRTLTEIREAIAARMHEDRRLYDRLMARALRLASRTFEDVALPPLLFIHGTAALLQDPSPDDAGVPMTTLRTVLSLIEEKHRLLRLLSEYIDAPGLTVVIGGEHPSPDLRGFSLVASVASAADSGPTVGVIGPRRMRYSRAIAAVDAVSRTVNRLLAAESN
jgi:heat-inducible transcriptional repressor